MSRGGIDTTIEVPDHLAERLPSPATPVARRKRLERAIHVALDHAGWPDGPRGEISVPAVYWYVNIFGRDGRVKGHVGPIPNEYKARDVARSWRKTGTSAVVGKSALGRSLTNPL